MASIRQVTWKKKSGTSKRWELSYFDAAGKRHRSLHDMKRDAEAERVRIEGQLAAGTHVADRDSRTVGDVCEAWLTDIEHLVRTGTRERITLKGYRTHVRRHIAPRDVARVKLTKLRPSAVMAFVTELEAELSADLAGKVFGTFKMALGYARRMEMMTHDPASDVKIRTTERSDREEEGDVAIPTKAELKALVAAAKLDQTGRSMAMISLMMFAGLRISELRGLTRRGVMLTGAQPEVWIFQRADSYQAAGPCKSKASRRRVPIGPDTVAAVRAWLPSIPQSDSGLIFPTASGTIQSYANLWNRWWVPLMIAAGLVSEAPPGKPAGKPAPRFGMHGLRHVAASLWIELGLQPKRIQKLMGHSTLQMTMDLYGHLWTYPDEDAAIGRDTERQLG
ncbi:hypothetical protein N825_25255 [Skermanella stibiiresistens SB22]|uniref:Tyr recombinase domain-containing protein n=1 Tax=Skermanella stibiiresistens SB22 TaxID=1385369 RepID=W9GSL7_9PROT|nr:site-specific integrase [Skermanella stibiiresistens]EWY36744.1 hypothetical protein N825_25255 [Skermanella stibiiresistens SB22]